jgi:hypothetical protein
MRSKACLPHGIRVPHKMARECLANRTTSDLKGMYFFPTATFACGASLQLGRRVS